MERSSKQGLLDLGPSFMRSGVKYAWSPTPQQIYGSSRPGGSGALQYAHSLVGLTPRNAQGIASTAQLLQKNYSSPTRALLRRTSSAPAQVRLRRIPVPSITQSQHTHKHVVAKHAAETDSHCI